MVTGRHGIRIAPLKGIIESGDDRHATKVAPEKHLDVLHATFRVHG